MLWPVLYSCIDWGRLEIGNRKIKVIAPVD
ncbi:Uncharacterised protein [Shigella sonnei]|nr:Uncharacterised protein [Shigella sonnei]